MAIAEFGNAFYGYRLVHLFAPCSSLYADDRNSIKGQKEEALLWSRKTSLNVSDCSCSPILFAGSIAKSRIGYYGVYWHGRKCFFTCSLDLFNNEMLTRNLGFHEALPFILRPSKTSGHTTILHTNFGAQYCSPAFTTLLKQNGIIIVCAGPAIPCISISTRFVFSLFYYISILLNTFINGLNFEVLTKRVI